MGLAGLGDLVLSCTDDQSRNRRFGLLLAQGHNIEQARAEIGQVGRRRPRGPGGACGPRSASRWTCPCARGVYRVLYEGLPADEVVRALMRRPMRAEAE